MRAHENEERTPGERRALLAVAIVAWSVLACVVVFAALFALATFENISRHTEFQCSTMMFARGGQIEVVREFDGGREGRALAIVLVDPRARHRPYSTGVGFEDTGRGMADSFHTSEFTYEMGPDGATRPSTLTILETHPPHTAIIDGAEFEWEPGTIFTFDIDVGWQQHSDIPEIAGIFHALDAPGFEIERRHRVWQLLQNLQEGGAPSAAD